MRISTLKNFIFSFLFIYFSYSASAQNGFVNDIFSVNGNYKYFLGTAEPDTNWFKPGFSDSGWPAGHKSIGFGDGDDSTQIANVPSVYLRIHFNVTDKSLISEANLLADFDDGYIAYLNGVEIVRVNLGKPGEHIPFDRVTDRSHEAVYCRYYYKPVTGYYIDTTILSDVLVNGENILAIQVHNDSVGGSDLTFNCSLNNYNVENYRIWNDEFRFIAQVPLDSSRLPIVIINTDEFEFPYSKTRYKAKMSIIYNPINEYQKPGDPFTDYINGYISIETRGNSTIDVPKNSFDVETQDANGENNNVSLLGMPADDDWILYAPFADKSLIRNELAFYLGRSMGYYEPRTRFCELILNGQYRGLYVLTEKIKRNANRVNVSQNSFDATSGVEITGGYVVGDNNVYPQSDKMTDAQYAYFSLFRLDLSILLNKPGLVDPDTGFRKFVDEQFLIDYILVQEIMKNIDAYIASTYLYKDRDDVDPKLKFGPLWDLDLSLGNTDYRNRPDEWMFNENITSLAGVTDIPKYLSDTVFVNQLSSRWFDLRTIVFSDNNLTHFIDSVSNYIAESRIRNYKVWPLLNARLLWPSYIPSSYEFEIDTMKKWLVMHAAWIDNNINKISFPLPTIPGTIEHEFAMEDELTMFPIPFNNEINIRFKNTNTKLTEIEIFDLLGKTIMKEVVADENREQYKITGLDKLNPGTYFITFKTKQAKIYTKKILKI